MVVMKNRVSVSSLSKVQLHVRHPWQESIFVICKNATTLFAHPVLCSDFTPRALKKFTFVLLLLYIGFCQSRGTGITGLDNVLLSRSSDLMDLLYRYISNTTSNQ